MNKMRTMQDVISLAKELIAPTLQSMLDAEMTEHLGYEKHDSEGNNSGNSRNGYSEKTLKTSFGPAPLKVPRDRNGTFEPIAVRKKDEISALESNLAQLGKVNPEKLKRAYTAFEISVGIGEVFEHGNVKEKAEALRESGSNLTLIGKIVSVHHTKMREAIINGLLSAKSKDKRFEPVKYEADKKDETEAFASVRTTLLRMLNNVRT